VRTLLSGLLVVLSATLAQAAETPSTCPPPALPPSPAQIQEGMKAARDRGFLWRITRGDRTSYLYGTIHVGRQEWLFPGPEVMAAVRASDVVALELDILDPALGQRLREGMALKAGQTLPAPLTRRLQTQLKAACLPDEILTTTSPLMVATTLTMMAGRREGLDPAFGIDAIYAGMARGLGKPVTSLETPELQLDLLLGGTAREIEAAVERALDDLEQGDAGPLVGRMASMWANGQLGELENYEKWCECVETDEDRRMMRRLLDERNPGLAKGIDEVHASGKRVFAAVGSLHMIGRMGLPALLAERGYKVERVDFRR
jgi:uncharacterized protein YbaP (TraB family)